MRIRLTLIALLLFGASAWALPLPTGQNVVHEVTAQDDLYTIARKYGLAPDHIMWANDVSHKYPPRVGDKLTIPLRRIPPSPPPGGSGIVLNLPERVLYLFKQGALTKFYGVAIGEDIYPTPAGQFRIMAKEKNPTWEPPKWLEKKAIPPGPDNPLGDRWMQITPDMVGIHGTNNPDSIGEAASLGCVRLYPEAIHQLYDQVGVGTPVTVIYEQVRMGNEADGTLVWSVFPDPYHKWAGLFQAQQGLAIARSQGQDIVMTDFEIEERMTEARGLIHPVYGQPVTVVLDEGALVKNGGIIKPTGNWLDATVLESRGYKISTDAKAKVVKIEGGDGKLLVVKPEKTPLNPNKVPAGQGNAPFRVDGHKWKGKIWIPFPLALDYFDIDYKWDKTTSTLDLSRPVPKAYSSP